MTDSRRARRQRSDGADTRARVLRAALDCIIEKGYYAASSNEIARHAGVTWGTLQHQFGTRENLLIEVMGARWREFEQSLETTQITGTTLEQRLDELLDVLAGHYDGPAHVAHVQIALDLVSNPASSDDARAAVAGYGRELTRAWAPMFRQVLGEAADDDVLVLYVFLSLRGFLTGNAIWARLSPRTVKTDVRRLLIDGIAASVRSRCAERGVAIS